MELKSHSLRIAKRFLALQRQSGLSPVVDHMPYLPNLASSKEEFYAKSVEALARELERCQALGIPYLVTHLGSHLGGGRKWAREDCSCFADCLFRMIAIPSCF